MQAAGSTLRRQITSVHPDIYLLLEDKEECSPPIFAEPDLVIRIFFVFRSLQRTAIQTVTLHTLPNNKDPFMHC